MGIFLKRLVLTSLSLALLVGAGLPMSIAIAQDTQDTTATEEMMEIDRLPLITKAQLAEANGKDGNPAHIAVFAHIYDVTDVEAWPEGEHNSLQAGTDASGAFLNESPHTQELLDSLEIVGFYVDWELTTELLAEFGPENEATPNLVAVQGIVYDVTHIPAWAEGEHNGAVAGTDATEIFAQSPHDAEHLARMFAVGRHIDYVFTEDELAQFNGKDGHPAYVAVDGIVYDVSHYDAWPEGQHNGVEAGTDASEAFKNISPHDADHLAKLPIAGKYE